MVEAPPRTTRGPKSQSQLSLALVAASLGDRAAIPLLTDIVAVGDWWEDDSVKEK